MKSNDPAVTAYAVCNGLGRTTEQVVASLAAGRSGLVPPPMPLPFETVCGAVEDELPSLPEAWSLHDTRQARIAFQTLEQIRGPVASAVRRWGADRVALVMATSTGGIAVSEDAFDAFKTSGRTPAGYDLERQHSFFAFVDFLRAQTGIGGPATVVSTACSSSGKVFGCARRLLAAGVADAVLLGGVDSLCRTTLCGFAGLSVLSPEPCRPFSARRQGMNIGEGGAMLLIEREGEARAVVLGVGESCDAHHMSSPHPEGLGARLAMRAALAEAGLRPSAVDHVNAHGTGTEINDAVEAGAIAAVFGGDVPVASTKGFTGHMLGAAGATEAVFAIVALEQQWLPASLGAEPVDPANGIRVVPDRVEQRCRVVMSNSFGFGGSNVSVLLGAA